MQFSPLDVRIREGTALEVGARRAPWPVPAHDPLWQSILNARGSLGVARWTTITPNARRTRSPDGRTPTSGLGRSAAWVECVPDHPLSAVRAASSLELGGVVSGARPRRSDQYPGGRTLRVGGLPAPVLLHRDSPSSADMGDICGELGISAGDHKFGVREHPYPVGIGINAE